MSTGHLGEVRNGSRLSLEAFLWRIVRPVSERVRMGTEPNRNEGGREGGREGGLGREQRGRKGVKCTAPAASQPALFIGALSRPPTLLKRDSLTSSDEFVAYVFSALGIFRCLWR